MQLRACAVFAMVLGVCCAAAAKEASVILVNGKVWTVNPAQPVVQAVALDGKNPSGWVPGQRISVADAVHAYTMGSAFAEHQEKVKGSIQPG